MDLFINMNTNIIFILKFQQISTMKNNMIQNKLILICMILFFQMVKCQRIVELDNKMIFNNSMSGQNKTIKLLGLSMYQDQSQYEHNYTLASNQTVQDKEPTNASQVLLCYIGDSVGQNYQNFKTECRQNLTKATQVPATKDT